MSQLLPSWTKTSPHEVGSDGILEEQGVGRIPPHLAHRPGVLLQTGVHVVRAGGQAVECGAQWGRHWQAWRWVATSAEGAGEGSFGVWFN